MVNINVDTIINILFSSIGIKENIPEYQIRELINEGKVKDCVERMADYMGLPMKVNLSYGSSFETKNIVKTDERGKGIGGITAQVFIPPNLPLYNKNTLTDFPIEVKLTGNVKSHPDSFMAIMAHELSHIVLNSIQNINKDNEFYTDITAMMLGFNEIIKYGRESTEVHQESNLLSTTTITEVTTYGYLDNYQFRCAYNQITNLIQKNKKIKSQLIQKYECSKSQLKQISEGIITFKQYLDFFDRHLKQHIRPSDTQSIVAFHQLGYIEQKEQFIQDMTKRLHQQRNYESIIHYFVGWETIFSKELEEIKSDISIQKSLLQQDLKILSRNLGIWNRIILTLRLR